MNAIRISVLLFFSVLAVARADETNALPSKITVRSGKYEDVRWGRVTAYAVTITHRTGIASIPLAELPVELQTKFNYDPNKAAAHRAQELVAQEQVRITDAEGARRLRKKQEADAQAAEDDRQQNKERQAAEQSEAKENRKNVAPVITISYSDVFNIRMRANGTYDVNLTTEGETTQLVFCDEGGRNYLRGHRRGKVYGTVVETAVVNQYGVQVAETAVQLLGATTYRDIRGNVTYGW